MLKIKGRFGLDRLTQTAGTVITQVVPPNTKGGRAVITNVAYVCAATAHTLTFMKALGQTVATAAAASGQAVVNVEAKTFLDQTVAANDFAVVQHSDGTYGVYLVSSVSSLAITFASNLTAAVADNAKIWWFGAAAEAQHQQILVTASVRNDYADPIAGVSQSGYGPTTISSTVYSGRSGIGDPIIVHSNNATNAGLLELVSGYYAQD
jgi:hypothetical protein